MLKDESHLFQPGKAVFDEREEAFKEQMIERYNIAVRETCLVAYGGYQWCARIYADYQAVPPKWQWLREMVKKSQFRPSLAAVCTIHASDKTEAAQQLETDIAVLYQQCFALNRKIYTHFDAKLLDYSYALNSYAYGHACAAIRALLSRQYRLPPNRITVPSEPRIVIVVDEQAKKQTLLADKQRIASACYQELKKHDPFSVIREESVALDVYALSEEDKGYISGLLMT